MENQTQLTPRQLLDSCIEYHVNTVGITVELLTNNSVLFNMYQQQLQGAIKSHTDKIRNEKLERINGMKNEILLDLQKYANVLAELGMNTKDNSLFIYAWNVDGKVELHVGNKTISKERMQTNGENAIVKTKYDWTAEYEGIVYETGASIAKQLGLFEGGKNVNYCKAVESYAKKHPELNIVITRKEK